MTTAAVSLREWAVRDVVSDRRARLGIGVLAFVAAASFGAQVAVPLPFTPVPITLQTLFVVLAGVVLGPRYGALSMGLYVAVGAAGAPVFSNGASGLPWLFGPTGGYLLAAPGAAFVAGLVAAEDRAAARTLVGLALGALTMYVGGVSWLVALTGESLGRVIALGALPFLAGDAVKVIAAWGIARATHRTSFNRF